MSNRIVRDIGGGLKKLVGSVLGLVAAIAAIYLALRLGEFLIIILVIGGVLVVVNRG